MSGFRGLYSTPTEGQAALVGHIVMDWAITEFNLRLLVRRLSFVPELLGRLTTARMTADPAIAKIEALLDMHQKHYCDTIIPYETRLAVAEAVRLAAQLRARRNLFSHRLCLRVNDQEMDFIPLDFAITDDCDPKASLKANLHSTQTVSSLEHFLGEIRGANEALEAVLNLLPETDEPQAV